MIKRCTIEDVEEVNRIMRHPEIYPDSIDDGSPPNAIDFDAGPALKNECVYFLAWRINGTWVGLWILTPHNTVTYEIHTCILPTFRGKAAIHASQDAAEWMYHNTRCRKIITAVPENNKPALFFALSCGMEKEGFIKASLLKDGKLWGQVLLGKEKGG